MMVKKLFCFAALFLTGCSFKDYHPLKFNSISVETRGEFHNTQWLLWIKFDVMVPKFKTINHNNNYEWWIEDKK